MYAVVETGGKQYKVAVGDEVKVEKLNAEDGEKVVLDKVIMVVDDEGNVKVGAGKVTAAVLGQGRHKKVVVFKYKRRKNSRRKQGHRQDYTKIKIEAIEL